MVVSFTFFFQRTLTTFVPILFIQHFSPDQVYTAVVLGWIRQINVDIFFSNQPRSMIFVACRQRPSHGGKIKCFSDLFTPCTFHCLKSSTGTAGSRISFLSLEYQVATSRVSSGVQKSTALTFLLRITHRQHRQIIFTLSPMRKPRRSISSAL